MAAALRALGVDDHRRRRRLAGRRPGRCTAARVDTGLAGTVMRFVPPVAALADGAGHLRRRRLRARTADGDAASTGCARPASRSTTAAAAGCRSPCAAAARSPAARCTSTRPASSQFVSGLLLAGARYDKGIEIVHTGDGAGAVAAAHRDDAGRAARGRGRRGRRAGPAVWRVAPGPIAARRLHVVEPDLSNAAPFLAAALVTGGHGARCRAGPRHTTQAGDALRDLLTAMGADVDARPRTG